MTQIFPSKPLVLLLLGVAASACAGSPASPFNQMEKSSVIAFRLQNYEPPAQSVAAAQPTAAGQPALIPGLPAEINQWIQAGAAGLQQLIPQGLLPQLPQPGAAVATPAPVENVPRFYGFRILGQTNVPTEDLRGQMAELFGDEDNFEAPKSQCMYPEMGVAFSPQPGGPSYDFLISFSCNQVQAKNFQWPHPQAGLKSETVKELSDVVRKLFPM